MRFPGNVSTRILDAASPTAMASCVGDTTLCTELSLGEEGETSTELWGRAAAKGFGEPSPAPTAWKCCDVEGAQAVGQ